MRKTVLQVSLGLNKLINEDNFKNKDNKSCLCNEICGKLLITNKKNIKVTSCVCFHLFYFWDACEKCQILPVHNKMVVVSEP